MISALSSMFTQAVKRGKMQTNPAMGIDKVHKADANANREWSPEEWTAATANAPTEIVIPMTLAGHCGLRGQTVASVQWKNYQPDPRFGKCFRHIAKKNKEQSYVPVVPEMQAFLDGLDRTSLNIATRTDGTPWASEKEMQTAVSHYLRRLERDGLIGAGTTLHGLRASYGQSLPAVGKRW